MCLEPAIAVTIGFLVLHQVPGCLAGARDRVRGGGRGSAPSAPGPASTWWPSHRPPRRRRPRGCCRCSCHGNPARAAARPAPAAPAGWAGPTAVRGRRWRTSAGRGSSPQGEQPDRPATDEQEGVEVDAAAEQAPVETDPRGAVRPTGLEAADRLPLGHRVAHRDGGRHRLVGGAQGPVVDHDHTAAGEPAGERDPSGAGGPDHLAPVPEQVHPPVTGAPRRGGRVEAAQDRWPGCERPGAARRGAEQHDEGDEEGDGGGHGAHGGGRGGPRRAGAARLWRSAAGILPVDGNWLTRPDWCSSPALT